MDLQLPVLFKAQARIDHQDIICVDDGKRLYFYQQAAHRPRLQVIVSGIERDETFGLVDGEGSFGQGDVLHAAKISISLRPPTTWRGNGLVHRSTICRSASSRTRINSMILNVSSEVPP